MSTHSFSKLFQVVGLALLAMVISCTGQSPADLKNKISSTEEKLSSSCNDIKLDGELLTKTNIQKIFECGTWSNQYPHLYTALKSIPETQLNSLLAPYNKEIFYDRNKQAKLLNILSSHNTKGDLSELGKFLNKLLGEYDVLSSLDTVLAGKNLNSIDRTLVFNVFSKNSEVNTQAVKSLTEAINFYQEEKEAWNLVFWSFSRDSLIDNGKIILNDLSTMDDSIFWNSISTVLNTKNEFNIKAWAQTSLSSQRPEALLQNLLTNPQLAEDSTDLLTILEKGLVCDNAGSVFDFNIRSEKELISKMISLEKVTRDEYQGVLLDSMSKVIAFKNFCGNSENKHSIDVFERILDTLMLASDNEHDYKFIQSVQKTFPKGREFTLLNLLASPMFQSVFSIVKDVDSEGKSNLLATNAFKVLSSLSAETQTFLSEILGSVKDEGKSKTWFNNWAIMWQSLSEMEQHHFVNLLSIVFDNEIKAASVANIIESVVLEYPKLTAEISSQFEEQSFYESLRLHVSVLSDPLVRDDLARFLSNDGLIGFLKVFTQNREQVFITKNPLKIEKVENQNNLVQSSSLRAQSLQRLCYEKLKSDYLKNQDYYTIVNTLPAECLNSLGNQGLVGQIYLWMNNLNNQFKDELKKDFHTGTGIWNPGMLQFIFASAVRADIYLGRSEGKGVKAWLPEIQSDLENPIIKERAELLLQISAKMAKETSVLDLVTKEMQSASTEAIKKYGNSALKLMGGKSSPYFNSRPQKISCNDLNQKLGANPCLKKDELKKGLRELLRVFKRKNENGSSVIKSLLSAIHSKGGVELPRPNKKTEKHVITLEEVIRFSHDLNSDQTRKAFNYYQGKEKKEYQGTAVERLEVIIRDISFLNDFYGAYFKNEVAQAENYREKLESSNKLMNWLQKFSGPFRSFGVFPKETKWLLKNARESYHSLIEVADEYKQPEGNTRNYADFIQSVLMISSSTSPLKTQSFGAFRKPDPDLIKNHNGIFITQITELSGLRHLSAWVESRFGSRYAEFLKSEDFQSINKNLLAKTDLEKFENAGVYLLDKYFEEDSDNLGIMIDDLVDWLYQATPAEINSFENLIGKVLTLMASEGMSSANIETLAEYIDLVVKHWPKIKSAFGKDINFSAALNLGNEVFDQVLANKKESFELMPLIINFINKIPKAEREEFFSLNMLQDTSALVKHFIKNDLKTNFDWTAAFSEMFFSNDAEIAPFKEMLSAMIQYPQKEITLSDYVLFLSTKYQGRSRYELLVEEIFTNQRQKLEEFLESTFQALN